MVGPAPGVQRDLFFPQIGASPVADGRLLLDQGFTGLRIVGSRFSRDTVRLTQFAARNGIPHTWIDVEDDNAAAEILAQLGVSVEEMPVVITGGGEVLRRPTIAELANTMGLAASARRSEMTDLLIVGAGPAGLAAAVYGASEGLQTVVLEAHHVGGQAGGSTRIENYLGFPTGISGAELTDRAQLQAQRFGAEISVPVRVVSLEVEPGRKVVVLEDGSRMETRALIVGRAIPSAGLDAIAQRRKELEAERAAEALEQADPVFRCLVRDSQKRLLRCRSSGGPNHHPET